MRKLWSLIAVMAVMLAIVVVPATVSAVSYDSALQLTSKNPSTWAITEDMKATLHYNSSGTTFDFSITDATGLGSDTNYSLIYYANPWPGDHPGALIGGSWLGSDIMAGTVSGSLDLGINLPKPPDSNMVVSHCGVPDDYGTCYGAKIWLVLSSDYDAVGHQMIAWHPESYLFETDLINYIDTNASGETGGSVSLSATIIEPVADIGVTVVSPSSIAFGEVVLGSCVDGTSIVLENTGNVPIKITAIPSAGFFTDCLRLNGNLVGGWMSGTVNPGDTITVATSVCVYTTTYAGSQTGSVVFVAQYSP